MFFYTKNPNIEQRIDNSDALKKEELLAMLEELSDDGDYEVSHYLADKLIIKYINDDEIKDAYDNIGKWYA